MRIELVSFFDEYSLGLRYIASSLIEAGHDIRLVFVRELAFLKEEPFDPDDRERVRQTPFPVLDKELDLLVDVTREFDPDLIGLSLVSSLYGLGVEATQLLRKNLDIPIAWGGIEPTISPDLAQAHADIVCVGEGERALVALADKLSEQATPGSRNTLDALQSISEPIDNLMIKIKGKWLTGKVGVMTPDLDTLPFPTFDLSRETYISEGHVYRQTYAPRCRLPHSFPVISIRGCHHNCNYCCHSVLKKIYSGSKYFRRRSTDNVIQELRLRKQQFPGIEMIEIEDDVFTLNQKWIDEFCEEYKRHIGVPFWCYTYPGISRESMLAPLKEAGLRSVTFGVQSGSQRVLHEVYNRPIKVESILETANVLKRLDLHFVVDLIGSNPLETDEDRIETVRILTRIPKPYLLHPINPITFYRNYPITETMKQSDVPLVQGLGATKYGPEPDPRFRAWDAILTLAHYPGIEEETLRPFWENEHLMTHPEPLEQLASAFAAATYYEGDIYVTKDRQIDILRERTGQLSLEISQLQNEMAELKGSRLVRWALSLRKLLGRNE